MIIYLNESLKISFSRKIEEKTKMDKGRNKIIRNQLGTEVVYRTVEG